MSARPLGFGLAQEARINGIRTGAATEGHRRKLTADISAEPFRFDTKAKMIDGLEALLARAKKGEIVSMGGAFVAFSSAPRDDR